MTDSAVCSSTINQYCSIPKKTSCQLSATSRHMHVCTSQQLFPLPTRINSNQSNTVKTAWGNIFSNSLTTNKSAFLNQEEYREAQNTLPSKTLPEQLSGAFFAPRRVEYQQRTTSCFDQETLSSTANHDLLN